MEPRASVLVIGYGNPGRGDDGLGPACAAALEQLDLPGTRVTQSYQLQIEDAVEVARHHSVLFIDAALAGEEPVALTRVRAGTPPTVGFSSHSLSPAAVLVLARELFGAHTRGYVLAIRGYAFDELGEGLSKEAQRNLAAAVALCRQLLALEDGEFDRPGDGPSRETPCQTTST
jgi:hydrogenase maturation protease